MSAVLGAAGVAGAISTGVILVEDGLQIVSQIIAAIQAARASGSLTISAAVLSANVQARNDAQKKLDADLAKGV